MRLKPHLPARVVWQEGMYLAPHHFQAQRRHAEDALALAVDALFPFAYGVASLALDEDALRAGTVALRHARGILPDGTPFHAPDADPLPTAIALGERFSPTRGAHVVHLALPAWRGDGANVADADALDPDGGNGSGNGYAPELPELGAGPRYEAVEQEVVDEVSGLDAVPIRVAAKRLRLALDFELGPGEVSLPIARVQRDGTGQVVFDADFIPPCLQLGASPRLVALLHGVVEMLDAKGATLAATMRPAGGGPAGAPGGGDAPSAYAGNEIATRWMLHAVRSAEAPLRHLLQTRRAHPERMWLELVRLAGALCTFSLTATPRDLPDYAHDDLADCFGALERHVRAHLDVVVTPRVVVVRLARTSEVLHVGKVTDARAVEPGARGFLAVRSSLGPVETGGRAPALVKACASKFVLELVRRAFPGMALEHVPAPPPAIAPRADRAYFEIALAGPCAVGLRETRELGVYVPDTLPDPLLELHVLVPG
jgi:type VI secretion system protein ImpJ